ncbi:MAG: DUF1835 domain-containing protein [Bauldia sp.]|nr:DUF1835 domain-containing protein [Bauldia sp.]
MTDLVITNGDSAADVLAAAGLPGRMVPWRDVLHEGPLVPAPSLSALSDIRARFLSERFGLPYAEARADFLARDAVVEAHALFDRVVIWVEHDLYDQLQLLQALYVLHASGRTEGLVLVQADDFIATQKPETVLRFGEAAIDLTPAMIATAAALWQALIAPSPEPVLQRLKSATTGFRFLRPALGRFIEELPATGSGLSRSARVALSVIAQNGQTPRDVFSRLLASEEAAFMGDWSVFRVLDDLSFASEPLVAGLEAPYPCAGDPGAADDYLDRPLALTKFGRTVLRGEADSVAINGIDRWWAGTHMTGHDAWRWDSTGRRLVPPGGNAVPVPETKEQDWP